MEHVFKESGVQIINKPPLEFPDDIDYQYYIRKTNEILYNFNKQQLNLF